eukprot:g14443.t1
MLAPAPPGDAEQVQACHLLRAFYRYHFFFTAIPLIFALVYTSFRGEGELCVFDGVSLGVYLSGVRGAGGASAVFYERTDQKRGFGLPLDAAWVTAEFLLGVFVLTTGGFWLLNTISGAVHVEEQEEEAKTVTSGVFASFLLFLVAPWMLGSGVSTYLQLSAGDPEKRNSQRVFLLLVLLPLLDLLWVAGERARHRCSASKLPRRGRTIFCVAKFVFAYNLWGVLTLMFGVQFVITLFPAVLRSVQDWPPLWKSAVELSSMGSYFILWVPLMEKAGGKILLPMVLPQRHDFDCQRASGRHSQTQPQTLDSVAPPYYTASTGGSEHARDFFSRDQNIASRLRRRRAGFQFYLQNCFDILRLVFGRGVLMQLSWLSFVVLILKDVVYHFWHFALRQQESILVFSIRFSRSTLSGYAVDSSSRSRLVRLLRWLWRGRGEFLAVFEERYDFLVDVARRSPNCSGEDEALQSVWFAFSNVRLVVENVPTELLRSVCRPVQLIEFGTVPEPAGLQDAALRVHSHSSPECGSTNELHSRDLDADGEGFPTNSVAGLQMTTTSSVAGPWMTTTNSVAGPQMTTSTDTGCVRSFSTSCFRVDARATTNSVAGPQMTGVNSLAGLRMTDTNSVAGPRMTAKVKLQASVGRVKSRIGEQLSLVRRSVSLALRKTTRNLFPDVSRDDSKRMEGFVRFFRQENFVRYQIRAQIRILVSLTMIFVPLISRYGNVYYYAGYPQDDSWTMLIVSGAMFLVKDVLEWYIITFRFMLCTEWRIKQFVPALFAKICGTGQCFSYRHLRNDGIAQAVVMGVLGITAYFCAATYALRWNAYNIFEIQTVTGYRDLEWKEIYVYCDTVK